MKINNSFLLGETVYIKTDDDQKERMITCIKVYVDMSFLYLITHCGTEIWCFECELSREKDYNKS